MTNTPLLDRRQVRSVTTVEEAGVTEEDVQFPTLLAGARSGDEASFAALWRRFDPMLRRFLAGLASPDDAADVASTVWLEIVRKLDDFVGDESGFKAWMFTIGRSRLVDLRRSRDRRIRTVDDDVGSDQRIGGAPDPADLVSDAAATSAAIELIGRLPEKQAEVVLLRVVADLDVETVARILGKKPGAVRVLSHRGLERLAELLAEGGDPR